MYKDRLRKWCIAKNIKASDINTLQLMATTKCKVVSQTVSSPDHQHHHHPDLPDNPYQAHQQTPPPPQSTPEFYVVGSRVIRSDRLQQAIQRRTAMARRAMMRKDHNTVSSTPPPQGWTDDSFLLSGCRPPFFVPILQSSSSPPTMSRYYQPLAPEALRVPEKILQNSHAFIQGLFDLSSPSSSAGPRPSRPSLINLCLGGPVQRLRLTFEETMCNLNQLQSTQNTTRLAFQSLNDAFGMIRPCLTAHDPQLVLILTQLLALCVYFRRPEIMALLLGYLRELTVVVLGGHHPLTMLCRELQRLCYEEEQAEQEQEEQEKGGPWGRGRKEAIIGKEGRMAEICKLTAHSSWHLLRTRLYPPGRARDQIDDTFVHLTAAYGDVLDSLGRADENEEFLRQVVEEMEMRPDLPPYSASDGCEKDESDYTNNASNKNSSTTHEAPLERISNKNRRIRMEMHLILALRRRGKYPEALDRLRRIRAELGLSSSFPPSTLATFTTQQQHHNISVDDDDDDATTELIYEVLRINGLCEIGGGDIQKGRALLWEAFELIQRTKGKYSPRTTRALRDCVRWWGEPGEVAVLMRDLEERLARFSLEGENPS